MDISTRLKRIKQMCYDPYGFMPETTFEWLFDCSIIDHERGFVDPVPFALVSKNEEKIGMAIESFKERENIVLYSGGKESFLVCRMLDFFDVPYKTVTIDERGRDSSKVKSDYRIDSSVISRLNNDQFGKHIPLLYYYILRIMLGHPSANVFVGAEHNNPLYRYQNMHLDHSDILFRELNNDPDIDGTVCSPINCLREFDTFRLAVNHFGYNPADSYSDNADKKTYIQAYAAMNDVYLDINRLDPENRRHALTTLDYLEPKIKIVEPVLYDFRSDMMLFLQYCQAEKA